jgi:hypothetical protein
MRIIGEPPKTTRRVGVRDGRPPFPELCSGMVTEMSKRIQQPRNKFLLVHLASLAALVAIAQACSSTPSPPAGSGGSGGVGGNGAQSDSGGGGQGGTGGLGGAGGQGGTGGQSGAGGQGGGGGSAADSGADSVAPREAGEGGVSCASLPLCDNFDSDTAGNPPSSSLWSLIGTKGCSGDGNDAAPLEWPIVVDKTQSHSPPNSVKISGGDSCGPVLLNTSAFRQLTGDVYGRFYVFLPTTTPPTFDHTALMFLSLTTPLNFGSQTFLQLASELQATSSNMFYWQYNGDSDVLPSQSLAGGMMSAYPAPSMWTCVEFHTSPAGAVETWVNGTAIAGLTFVPGTTVKNTTTNNQWTPPPSPFTPTAFGLGWIVYTGAMTDIWFDDVALSSSRIGCE